MKKSMVIGGFLIAIVVVLFFHHQMTSSVTMNKSQMDGHNVISLMTNHYKLDEMQVQELERMLSSVDVLIQQSFNEALEEGAASATLIKERIKHMERVSYLGIQLMIAYEKSSGTSFTLEQAEDLMLAGYLHDIRKYAEGNHAKQGEKYVIDNIATYAVTLDEGRIERIGKLIRYHSDPLTDKQRSKLGEDAILEELLQDADTADKILNRGQDMEENITTLNLKSSVELVKAYQP